MKKNNLNQDIESFLMLSSYNPNMTLSENFSSVKVITEPTKTNGILNENTLPIAQFAKDAVDNVLNPFFKGLSQTVDQAGNQIIKVAGRDVAVARGFLDDVTQRINTNATGWWDDLVREASNGSAVASKTMDDLLKIIDADPNIANKAFDAFAETVKNKHAADASARNLTQWAIDIYTLTQKLNKTTEQVIDDLFVDNKLLGRTLKNGLSKEVNNLDETTKEAVRAMIRSGGKLSPETFKGVVYQYMEWVAQVVQMGRVYLLKVTSKDGKQAIEQELKDLVARIATKVANPNKQAVSSVDTELRQMFDVLQGAKNWMSETYDQLAYKYFIDNKIINSLPEYEKLLKEEPELAKILNSGRLSAREAATEIFMTSMRAQFGLIWPSTREIIVKNAAGKELSRTVVSRRKNWFGRWWNVIKRGSPLYTNEARYINTLGGPYGWAMDQFIVNAVIIHTFLATLEDLVSNAINNITRVEFVKSDIENQIELLCNPQKFTNADGVEETMPQFLSAEECEKMRITLESMKAPAISSLTEIWSDELDEAFGIQGLSLEEDFDWRKVVPLTKIDNLSVTIYDALVKAASYNDSVWEGLKGSWKNWVLEQSLKNDNFKQMYDNLKSKGIDITSLETIIETTSKTVQKDAAELKEELRKNFYTEHPKLKDWTDASFGITGVQWSGDEQIKVKGVISQKEWTGKKIDGKWQWLMPDGTYKDMGEGENPDKAPTQTNTGQMNSSGVLTPEKAQEIGFDLNRVLTEFRKSDENAQVYQTTDNNKVLIYYGGKTYASSKVGDDAWVYDAQPSTYVYSPNPQRGGNTEVETNTGGGTSTGGDSEILKNSYINRKNLINQVNPKTLKESIRNKVLLKHEDKKLKIKKINENLRKFEEQFYYENYEKFFNKMFKLAESYKKSKLYLNEDDNAAFDEALLKSGLFKGQEDRMKKEFSNYISSKLELVGEVKSKFGEKVKDYPFENIGQLFTDTDKVNDLIYQSFVETLSTNGEEPRNFMTALQNVIKPHLKTADFERNFKSTLKDLSNPVMDKARRKVDNLVDKIKELLAKEDSES